MYSKIIINALSIIGLVVVQVSFINALPALFNNLNLVLVVLILILWLGNFNLTLWWSISAGTLLDIYSFMPFGIYLISLLATILLANFLLSNFFTNRSLYSFLALTLFAFIWYEFLLYFIGYLAAFLSREEFILNLNLNFWLNELSQLIINLLLVLVIFYVSNFAGSRLKPVFLFKYKS